MASRRYVLKPDPHSSHSVILRWLGDGRGRRLLDVGAADGLLSRQLTARGWRVTAIEGDPALAQAGAAHCERMITVNLGRWVPDPGGPFDVIVYADVLEHLADPLRVLVEQTNMLKHSVDSGANASVGGRQLEVDRVFVEHAHLRKYFLDGVDLGPPDPDHAAAVSAAQLLANYFATYFRFFSEKCGDGK